MFTRRDMFEKFMLDKNYDICKTKNGRAFDQKLTPDNVQYVAMMLLEYCEDNNNNNTFFTVANIWHHLSHTEAVSQRYKKPETDTESARREYDKFFGQPIKFFWAAGLLEIVGKERNATLYSIANPAAREVLENISLSDNFALEFIACYAAKWFVDSGLSQGLQQFFNLQTKETYISLRDQYIALMKENTGINGETELRRIFPKLLNPIAYTAGKKGSESGQMSSDVITRDMLLYNRKNFRDKDKPKGISRGDYQRNTNEDDVLPCAAKAKSKVKKYNDKYNNSASEHIDDATSGVIATQMHHIFPSSHFPDIAGYPENIIAIEPNQHYLKAHPQNNTAIIDEDYQKELLVSKIMVIENSQQYDDSPYDFNRLKEVLEVGYDTQIFDECEDFQKLHEVFKQYV